MATIAEAATSEHAQLVLVVLVQVLVAMCVVEVQAVIA